MKTKINININKDDSELNDFLYCWGLFNKRPNKIIIYNSYSSQLFSENVSDIILDKTIFTEVVPTGETVIINDKILAKVSETFYISYLVIDRMSEESVIHDIVFYFKDYDSDISTVNELISKLDNCIYDYDLVDSVVNLNTLSLSQSGLEIESIDISNIDIDNIEQYYNKKTFKNINQLSKLIRKSKKGLSILHGPRGTGKTSIVKYLSECVDKMVVFLPNNMIDSTINNPEFKNFIKKHQNLLIVIDDCEVAFSELFTRSNIFSNNLLQLVDGPISDSLGVNILLIFNVECEDEIDHSILECNNLLSLIEINSLEVDQSNELANLLGGKKKYKNKTKIVDIIKNRTSSDVKKIGL